MPSMRCMRGNVSCDKDEDEDNRSRLKLVYNVGVIMVM